MTRLVFGILAVALLEIAFIGYATIEGIKNAAIDEVRSPFEKGLELARVEEIPEFAAPFGEQVRPEFAGATASIRQRSRSYPTVRQSRLSKSDFEPSTTIIRSGPGIPSGYTMVLVDYLPGLTPNYKPRSLPSNEKPKSNTQPNVPTTAYPLTRSETPRKRPFLVRTVPAVVKKPWKWMSSVASRFN